MKNPFSNQDQIPVATQKQLAFPTGDEGIKIGDSLWNGNAEVIDKTIKHIDYFDGIRICDIGCGPGYSLQKIAASVSIGEIVGIDPSEEMCEQAIISNKKDIKSGLIKVLKGKTPHLPVNDNYFDYALLSNVIYFWKKEEIETHLNDIYRILNPAGKLLIYMTSKNSLSERISETDGVFTFYEKSEVLEHLNHSGFKEIKVNVIKRIIKQTGLIIQASK